MRSTKLSVSILSIIAMASNTSSAALDKTIINDYTLKSYNIEVPHNSVNENCYILERFPKSSKKDYMKSDLKEEKKLCSYNLYATDSTHKKNKEVTSCPKVKGSSVAIEYYKLPKGMNASAFRKEVCTLTKSQKSKLKKRKGYPKKIAKFKFSAPGVSTGANMAYYHVSRFLGIKSVPPVVLRTVDEETNLNHALAGRYLGDKFKHDLLYKFWSQVAFINHSHLEGTGTYVSSKYQNSDNALGIVPSRYYSSKRKRKLISTGLSHWTPIQKVKDEKQIYGSLLTNPRGEGYYQQATGKWKKNRKRVDIFRKGSAYYSPLKINRPINEILKDSRKSKSMKEIGQKLKGMQDTSNMLVLDYLFHQSDRIGNIHYYNFYYYKNEKGEVKMIKESKYKDLLETPETELKQKDLNKIKFVKNNGAKIKVMLLKDNDGGFENNITRKYHLLAKVNKSAKRFNKWVHNTEIYKNANMMVKHIDPKTYEKVGELYNMIFVEKSEDVKNYFINGLQLTNNEWKLFKSNLESLYFALKTNCQKGKLYLDLDMKGYFDKTKAKQKQSC